MIPTKDLYSANSEGTQKCITKPEIIEEEDKPFPTTSGGPSGDITISASETSSYDLEDLIKLKNQRHDHDVEDFKNTTGKHILYGCLIAVVLATIADVVLHPDSTILTGAVDLAKVVATTILGYFFGSKSN